MLSRPKMTVGYRRFIVALIMLTCFAFSLQAQATVQITSPANGTVVHPGDTVTVGVSASGAAFVAMMLEPQIPLDNEQILTAPPYQFSLQVPSDITPGTYSLIASGATAAKNRGLRSLMRRHRHNLTAEQHAKLSDYLRQRPALEQIYPFKQRLSYLLLEKGRN